MNKELIDYLQSLASKYETKEFLVGDPSWFMHQVEGDTNKELLAFIASALSYGSRKQFLPKIQSILDSIKNDTQGDVSKWLIEEHYARVVPPTPSCFYRLYTCKMFNEFLSGLAEMVRQHDSIKGFLQAKMSSHDCLEAISHLTKYFWDKGSVGVIPKDTKSSCKRVCMFLRWMVRTESPVDLGLWSDIIDCSTLIIPMDTHVVQEAKRLGLLTSTSTSMPNARRLSQRLAEYFPGDPIKGDFALFGIGVDNSK